MIPGLELAACGPLAVPHEVMEHVVHVESSRNPFAIGVVGGRLLRQPRNLAEAAATVRMLEANGHNYSIGLAQVNRVNFARFGLDTLEQGFDVCNNLAAGAKILAECLQRHDGRWGDAFSCYYSGNARTGYEHGYVQKVFGAMAASRGATAPTGEGEAIPLAPPRGASTAASAGDGSRVKPISTAVTPSAGWEAILAARISAPDARRAQPVARAEPVTSAAGFVSAASSTTPAASRPVVPADTPSTIAGIVPTQPSGAVVLDAVSPEARLVMEMQQRVSTESPLASSSAVPSIAQPTDIAAGTPVNNQESSNSQKEDAARVF